MELMLWMKEKGLVVVDEPSQEPSNILQKLKRHEAAERELLATHGHVEGLQQVGALDRGCRAYSSSSSLPSCTGCFHGMHSLKEELTSFTMQLGCPAPPASYFTQQGSPWSGHPNQPQNLLSCLSFSFPDQLQSLFPPPEQRPSPPLARCLLPLSYLWASEENSPISAHRLGPYELHKPLQPVKCTL